MVRLATDSVEEEGEVLGKVSICEFGAVKLRVVREYVDEVDECELRQQPDGHASASSASLLWLGAHCTQLQRVGKHEQNRTSHHLHYVVDSLRAEIVSGSRKPTLLQDRCLHNLCQQGGRLRGSIAVSLTG